MCLNTAVPARTGARARRWRREGTTVESRRADMRVTGYRAVTTVQDWGRPVGDANGVFVDGVVEVPLVLVDTDEGITGVGLGSHVELGSVFAAIEGQDPRSTSALYDRMLRSAFKAGHAGAIFGA